MEPRILQSDVQGEGETIVLIPGGLTGWDSWIPHQQRLADRYRVIRLQPIHNELGSAGKPGDPGYTPATERESLRLTLDALGIDAAHFAGWSAGGRALIEFVIAHPGRVRTLTLVEPAASWLLERAGERDPEGEAASAFFGKLAGRAVTEEALADFLHFAGLVAPGEDPRRHPAWERWVGHRTTLSWMSEEMRRSDRTLGDLSRIVAPTLLVHGSRTADWLKRVVALLAEKLPDAAVLELDGDHACHIQGIDPFLDAFEAHLQREHGEGRPV